ncbi:DUF4397 domain-containing protein [Hymenobacter sp. NST-14]|uniref:DUF4397 domain-containing protein n=1 Tax=Hymenobacter piscis TaxID=2839984 RepID=UPI001C02D7F1|nr:DUF4397 domain-containing protein [Hymenobacter piscis]MBT9394730.1 DUF4397 domain-containing protein [Hymenobacter piscis]
MKTLTSIFRPTALLLTLPAVLAFSACSNDDDTPAPDRGQVLFSHAAAASAVPVKALIKGGEVGSLNYGNSTGYLTTNADTATVRVNVASSGQGAAKTSFRIEKDKNYSVFAYSPSASFGSVALKQFTDDLTAPAANQAKVRIVHLAVGVPSPVRLTVPSVIPGTAGSDITPDVAFGNASEFFAVNAGAANLVITAGSPVRTQVLAVGDGSGSGTGTKTFEAGKIYTIVVRGIAGATVPADQQPKAVIIQNK